MKSISRIAVALVVGSLPLLAACTTTSDANKSNTVTIKKGNFEGGDSGLGNDIQSILAQGGLNTSDPSAAVQTAQTDNGVKTLSTTATDLQTLVAQLDASSKTAIAQTTTQAGADASATAARTPALALAAPPKSTPQAQIIETIQTVNFETIGAPSAELVPVVPPTSDVSREKTRTVANNTPKPAPKSKRVATPKMDTSYRKPIVERF